MKRMLALGWVLGCLSAMPQTTAQTADTSQANTSSAPTTVQGNIYRDPYTGRLYQQEFQTIDQPVTTWQRKYVNRTVVTPQTVVENQQVPQTYYVAKTEYVMQAKLKGWWNPFAQPTYAYEYVPVTRWVPQTQMVTRQVPTVKMLASTEKVPIDEPVQTTQKVTQVVNRPLPANGAVASTVNVPSPQVPATSYANHPSSAYLRPTPIARPSRWPGSTASYSNAGGYSTNGQPLLASVPILGRQPAQTVQAGSLLRAPINGMRSVIRATTAPFNGQSNYSSYAQPMNVASQPNSNWGRDNSQAGLPATVVR